MDRGIRPLNVTLLTLLVVATISGVVAFGVGFSGPARWVIAVHGAAGLGLLLLAPAKIRLARRGLRRPGRSRKVISLTFTVLVLAAIGSGLLHAVGGWRPYLGLLPMQLHVGAAVGAVALLIAHVVMHHRSARRRWRPLLRRTDLTRRRALVGTGVVAGCSGAVGDRAGFAASRDRIARGRLGEHRDRSRHAMDVRLGAPDRACSLAPPDPGQIVRPCRHRRAPQSTVRAVLDCTGGWFTEQEWRGVPLSALGLPQGASIEVVSTTGYRRRFPAHEAGTLLLATHASGRPLSRGHGGPARIVAPGRRGFWWVKWVASIDVVDEPWWSQPPFPLQ